MSILRIYAEPLHGHWTAWVEGRSATHSCGGDTAASALLRLLELLEIDPDQLEPDHDASYDDRQGFRLRQCSPCPECRGSGRYVGLVQVEPCRNCNGSGLIAGST